MSKEMKPFEIGRIAMYVWQALSLAALVYGLYALLWNALQFALIPIGTLAERELATVTTELAKSHCITGAIVFALGVISFVIAIGQMRRLELRFKKRFLPQVLSETFTDFSFEPEKLRQEEETLCEVGLLRYSERYYSANRLKGMYRGCWVAAEEIICGGVYGDNYSSHKVCVRGQWMSIRLNTDFTGTVILEPWHTKNRFTHRKLAKTMCEVAFQRDEPFGEQFRCFATSAEEAQRLLSREMAQKLLNMTENYPDFCVIFRQGYLHVLLRRRSFNRRLDSFVPFSRKLLQNESVRLYGALQDFTDVLLA